MILKGKPVPTLSHLHPEYRKAVLQSATALSKYTGTVFFIVHRVTFAVRLHWIRLKEMLRTLLMLLVNGF